MPADRLVFALATTAVGLIAGFATLSPAMDAAPVISRGASAKRRDRLDAAFRIRTGNFTDHIGEVRSCVS